jgi:hypothetical protein
MPQPIAFLQKSFLTARAADRRRQTSRNLTDTGQCWKNADDGVQEIFVESVAQFVAAVESLDMQSHGKWGRCVFLQLSTPSTPSTLGSAALMQIDQVRLRVSRPAKLHVAAPDVSDALRQLTRSRSQSRTAHRQEFPEVHHPPPHTPVTRLHTWTPWHCRYTSAGSVALPQPCSSNIWGLLAYMQVCLMRRLLLPLLRYTVFTRPCLAAPRVAHSPARLDVLCPRRASLCHHRKRTHGG